MVFSSMVFVFLFLALNVIALKFCKNLNAKNKCMLIFSLVFYSWAGLGFTLLLLLDTFFCWIFAKEIESSETKSRKKRMLVYCLVLVLLVLAIFKYTGFFLSNFQWITGVPEIIPQIALPVGISFYTFQLISYVVDVYRGEVAAQKKYWILLLYASLYHQCVAGPIVRYSDIEHDIMHRRTHPDEISRGISRFTIGLAKKAVLANACAAIADTYLLSDVESLRQVPVTGLWLGGLAFMLQIYLDFSAYSDMAIGMGLMCGFHYKENFNYPYAASSVTDFWRRWHISLSSFFRDYVYIPLGGNRKGKKRQILNLLIVWALTGFWHGASWNYIFWGLYFFVFLVLEKFVLSNWLESVPKILRRVFVLLIVYFCWIIFKFTTAETLFTALGGMFGLNGNTFGAMSVGLDFSANYILLIFSIIACFPLGKFLRNTLMRSAQKNSLAFGVWSVWEVVHPAALLIISAMALTGNSYNPFLYYIF